MSDVINAQDAADASESWRAGLQEVGVSEALIEKAEGVSLWLQDKQSKLEKAYSHCPCFRVDAVKMELAIGDVLLDEWRASILSVLGTWNPDQASFALSPHDRNCPDAMSQALAEIIATDHCLQEIPEANAGSLADVSEEHVWLLTGVMAMALEADGIHVVQGEEGLVFLAIKSLRRMSAEERVLDASRAARIFIQMTAPVAQLFQHLTTLLNEGVNDEEFVNEVLPSLLQDTTVAVERVVGELEMCANHARMADSPIAEVFEEHSERYRRELESIDQAAKAQDFDTAFSLLASVGVMIESDLATQAKIVEE